MKIFDGNWGVKEGFNIQYAQEVYSYECYENSVVLYAPFKFIANKGNTLNNGMITIVISGIQKSLFHIKLYHYLHVEDSYPSFNVSYRKVPIVVSEEDQYIKITNDNSYILVNKTNLDMRFFYNEELVMVSQPKSKLYVQTENNNYMVEQLSLGIGEKIYGFGEQFTSFVKNGQSVEIWNEDGGTGTEQAYKNIPFYISNKNYGIFVNTPEKISFEVGSEKVANIQFSVRNESLDYYYIPGNDMKEVLTNYTDLTGKSPLPPHWSFGLWLSTSFLTNYDENTVISFVDKMFQFGIPIEVFHFDCLWMKEFEWCNFEWNPDVFPNPKKMLGKLKNKKLNICLWINPYIAQKSKLFREGAEKGYFLKKKDGSIWQWDKWQAGQAIVDFTNPDAKKWYQGYLKKLIDMGITSFKTDFGERIPVDVKYFDGSDPYRMHNYYPYLYNQTVYELLKEELGEDQAIVFARSATVGCQKFPVHWGGDCTPTYDSMAETLRAGLSFGLSGFSYWSHDISGFESGCTPDIFKRWTQFGLLSSHSRYHGSKEYKVPWMYGDEAVEVTKKFTQLKLSLMPYIWKEAVLSSKKGWPLLRPVFFEHQKDRNTHTLDTEYLLGSKFLIAPIFNDKGTVDFYLPDTSSHWFNFLDGEILDGGKWYKRKYDYFNMPLFVPKNSIVVEGSNCNSTDYEFCIEAKIHIYDIDDNVEVIEHVYNQNCDLTGQVKVIRKGDLVYVKSEGFKKTKIVYHKPIIDESEQKKIIEIDVDKHIFETEIIV